jgi:hypothetical protein
MVYGYMYYNNNAYRSMKRGVRGRGCGYIDRKVVHNALSQTQTILRRALQILLIEKPCNILTNKTMMYAVANTLDTHYTTSFTFTQYNNINAIQTITP